MNEVQLGRDQLCPPLGGFDPSNERLQGIHSGLLLAGVQSTVRSTKSELSLKGSFMCSLAVQSPVKLQD